MSLWQPIALFLLWQAGLTLACCAMVTAAGWHFKNKPIEPEDFLLAVIATNIVLSSFAAEAFSFLRINGLISYSCLWALLLAAAIVLWRRGGVSPGANLRALLPEAALVKHPVIGALFVALLTPVVLVAIRPIIEIDSLYNLQFMSGWIANRSTPYLYTLNFVPFPELAYVPVRVITGSAALLWAGSLLPVMLCALALYLLAVELGMSRRLSMLLAASAIALQHYWVGPSGVSTIKNDMLYNAGILMVALVAVRAVRSGFQVRGVYLLAAAGVFASAKHSGFALLLCAVALLALFNLGAVRRRPGAAACGAAVVALVHFAGAGHYWLRNVVAHGNIFYPFQMKIPGLPAWPGTMDTSGTSILSSLGDGRTWQLLFLPDGGRSPGGILFPLVLAAALAASAGLLVSSAVGWLRERRIERVPVVLAVYILAAWMVYFASFVSASALPGDLVYLRYGLSTLRYAEAALGMSEIFLAYLFLRAGGSPVLVAAAAALNLASRLAILWDAGRGNAVSPLAGTVAGLVLAGVFLALSMVRRPVLRAAAMTGCLTLALVAAGPWVFERNALQWPSCWQPALGRLRQAAGGRVFVAQNGTDSEDWAYNYLAEGPRMQNEVRRGSEAAFRTGWSAGWKPDYVLQVRNPNQPDGTRQLREFAARLASLGYFPDALSSHALLLVRMPVAQLSATGGPGGREVLAGPGDRVPAAGDTVDDGNGIPGLRTLRPGDLVLAGSPPQLFRLASPGAGLMDGPEGAVVKAVNAGPVGLEGRALGLNYARRTGVWVPDLQPVRRLNEDYDFRAAVNAKDLGNILVAVPPGGSYSVEYLADAYGPFVRVRAGKVTPWLTVFTYFPKGLRDQYPVTVRGRVRCPAPGRCSVDIFDFTGPGNQPVHAQSRNESGGAWETLSVFRRVVFQSDRDYFATGLIASAPGEYIDIRELSLLSGRYAF